MDVSTITQIISSIGFPIVACGFMYKLNIDQQREHLEEVAALREVIEANTQMLHEIKETIAAIRSE